MIAIYKITNTVNGMVYVGQTKRPLHTRWIAHCCAANKAYMTYKLQKAILEHGRDKFTIEQIDSAETKDEANEKEVYWIDRLDSIKNGYNSARGGKDSGSGKKVVKVETGEVYVSMVEAAKDMNCSPCSIRQAVKNNWKSCGYHWKFADEN